MHEISATPAWLTKPASIQPDGPVPLIMQFFYNIHAYLYTERSSLLTLKEFYYLSRVNKFFRDYVSTTLPQLWQIKPPGALTTNKRMARAIFNSTPRQIAKVCSQLFRFNLSLDHQDPSLKEHSLTVSAVDHNCHALLKLALRAGASPNGFYLTQNFERVPLLAHASVFGQIKVVGTLIEARAHVDQCFSKKRLTTLTLLVRELLNPEVSITRASGYDYKAYMQQIFLQRTNKPDEQKACLQMLLKARDPKKNHGELNTLLLEASHAGHSEIVQTLIAAKADVNACHQRDPPSKRARHDTT